LECCDDLIVDELESSMQSLIIRSAPLTSAYVTDQVEAAQISVLSSTCESGKRRVTGQSGSEYQTVSPSQYQTLVPSQEKTSLGVKSSASPDTSTGDNIAALNGVGVAANNLNRWTPEKTPICRVNELARFNKVSRLSTFLDIY
jgi:hypothetical protein